MARQGGSGDRAIAASAQSTRPARERRKRNERSHSRGEIVALSEKQPVKDELRGIPQARVTAGEQPCGIDGEADQPSSKRVRKILGRRWSRGSAAIASGLFKRWRCHGK